MGDRSLIQTVQLGGAGPVVGVIGLGCMAMSGLYGPADAAQSRATIRRALDLGVTLLDTADVYGSGANEELVGQAVRGRREEAVIATKFGFVRDTQGQAAPRGLDGRPEYVRAACDASLRRLGIDTIDLYQLHRVDPQIAVEETVGAMAGLVAAGKVRHLGLSEVSPDQLRRAASEHRIASVQSEYSVFAELDIGLLAYAPLVRGLLAGSLPPVAAAAEGDTRAGERFPRITGQARAANTELAGALDQIGREHGASAARVALAWLLHRPYPVVPIPGTRRVAYVEDNAQSPELTLTAAELARLDGLASLVHGARYGGDAPDRTR
jgi:aryl-alcohol dehydrogenase-like predicted oxidoreductase